MSGIARFTTVAIVVGLAGGAVVLATRAARPQHQGQHFRTYAYFRDAAGLPVGASVKIAGIVVGEIDSLAIENGQARLGMRLRDDVVLWDDAWVTKKATSALADNYVEISPGGPDPEVPQSVTHRRLRSGEPIARVVEAATTDRVLRGLEHAIPRGDEELRRLDDFTEESRQWVAGPLSERLARLDRDIASGKLSDPLHAAADASARFDDTLARAAADVHRAVPALDARLDGLVGDSARARDRIRSSRAELADGLADLRRDLDQADEVAARAKDFLGELAEPDRERQGTLARLIDDPSTGDELVDVTTELRQSAADLDRLKAVIGLRAEWNLLAAVPRFYVTAEITARRGQFYNIEIEKGPWGDRPDITITQDPVTGAFDRTVSIHERARFTVQWGQRFGRFAVRGGIKESMFGVGVDAAFGDGRLKLSLDAMESSFARTPRLKLAAALEVFRSIYVLGGIDDALIAGEDLDIGPADQVPKQFQRLRYGRDYQLGFDFRFTDRDVSALLRLYGSFLAALFAT